MKSGRRLKEANVLFLIDVTKCNKDILQSIFLGVEDIAFSLKIPNDKYHFSCSSICYADAINTAIFNWYFYISFDMQPFLDQMKSSNTFIMKVLKYHRAFGFMLFIIIILS